MIPQIIHGNFWTLQFYHRENNGKLYGKITSNKTGEICLQVDISDMDEFNDISDLFTDADNDWSITKGKTPKF